MLITKTPCHFSCKFRAVFDDIPGHHKIGEDTRKARRHEYKFPQDFFSKWKRAAELTGKQRGSGADGSEVIKWGPRATEPHPCQGIPLGKVLSGESGLHTGFCQWCHLQQDNDTNKDKPGACVRTGIPTSKQSRSQKICWTVDSQKPAWASPHQWTPGLSKGEI